MVHLRWQESSSPKGRSEMTAQLTGHREGSVYCQQSSSHLSVTTSRHSLNATSNPGLWALSSPRDAHRSTPAGSAAHPPLPLCGASFGDLKRADSGKASRILRRELGQTAVATRAEASSGPEKQKVRLLPALLSRKEVASCWVAAHDATSQRRTTDPASLPVWHGVGRGAFGVSR